MLGVASVKYADDKVIGKRAKPFSYTGKNVIPEKEFQAILLRELNQIKEYKADDFGRKGKWTVNIRQDGVLYDNDELIVIKGISKQKMILLNNHYINKVSDLKEKLTTITEKKN